MTFVVAVLVASLLGSVHCAAMCGGFVCFYAGASGPRRSPALWPHLAYNAGRLASYLIVGAIAGVAGARVDALGMAAGVQRSAAIVAGMLMIAWGGSRVAAQFGARLPVFGGTASTRLIGGIIRRLGNGSPSVRAAAIGTLSALLPCGWLYVFVVTAAGTASPLMAAGVMLVFWAGTLPMMLSLGTGVQRLAGSVQRRLPALSAAALVVLGLLSITGHMRPPAAMPGMHHAAAQPAAGVH